MFGCFAGLQGSDPRKAIYEAKRLEPLSAPIACDVGFTLYATGNFEGAIEACHDAIDLHPSFSRTYVCLARAHAALGNYGAAVETCLKGRPLFVGRAFLGQLIATHAWSCARMGQTDQALAGLAELQDASGEHFVARFDLAVIHTGLGNAAFAISLLEEAAANREFWAISIPTEPLLRTLHGEPRFRELSNRIFHRSVVSR